ncbi:MAG TPA: sugar ABC transporter permease [Acetobacteraceae bacterium]|nr:sugar ABC transporter permease [Acetobacteraceae bacterium]
MSIATAAATETAAARRRGLTVAARPYLLIAPSLVFLLLLFLVPLLQTIALAFHTGAGPGFGNFAAMLDDLDFNAAVRDTFALVIVVVPLQLALALGMSMMLRHLRRGRDLVLWIWSIPLGISDLAAGLVWLAILTDKGYLNTVLFHLGAIARPQSWLTYETPFTLFLAILAAEMWRATAIVFVILVAGVQLVPREFEEAASVFGATPWQRFRRVTLPLLRPSIQTALILRTVLAFETFAVVLAIGGRNFPVLISQAFEWQNAEQNYGVAAAYAVLIMAITLAATLVFLIALRPRAGEAT